MNARITLDELKAEVARIEASGSVSVDGAFSVADIAKQLNVNLNRAREIIKLALEQQLMRVVRVRRLNMAGLPQTTSMYQPVAKPKGNPIRAKK